MSSEIFIITPKRREREKAMSLLPSELSAIEDVDVLGKGETCFKIAVPVGADFQSKLSSYIRNSCFIERAVVFNLAGER